MTDNKEIINKEYKIFIGMYDREKDCPYWYIDDDIMSEIENNITRFIRSMYGHKYFSVHIAWDSIDEFISNSSEYFDRDRNGYIRFDVNRVCKVHSSTACTVKGDYLVEYNAYIKGYRDSTI